MYPIYKKQKDLEKGDIIKVEFGDYDNWVTVVVDEVSVDCNYKGSTKLDCHYLNSDRKEVMYGRNDERVEVIGVEQ